MLSGLTYQYNIDTRHLPALQRREKKNYCAAEIKMGFLKAFHPLLVLTPDSLLPTLSLKNTPFLSNRIN